MAFRKLRNSSLFLTFTTTFNRREEKALGRLTMLASALLAGGFSNLALGGALYTAFLTANDFSIVDTGYLTVFSTLASLLMVLFSPILMDKIMRRGKGVKFFLCGVRLFSYSLSIIGITLITLYVPDKDTKYFLFVAISFTTTLLNTLVQPGFTFWHANFISDEESRTKYMSISQILSSFSSGMTLIISGLIADAVRGTSREIPVLCALRVVAFVLLILEIIVLLRPREYPYVTTESKVKIRYIFSIPLRNKKFMFTMLIMVLWTLSVNIPATWVYYLINSVEMKITLMNTADFLYSIVQMMFMAFTLRFVRKVGWAKSFGIFAVFQGISDILLSMTGLFPIGFGSAFFFAMRMIQHVIGVTLNISWANFPYMNTPVENRNYYFSFYYFITYLFTALGQYLGTLMVKVMGDTTVRIFGGVLEAPALLKTISGTVCTVIAVLVLCFWKTLQPTPEEKEKLEA